MIKKLEMQLRLSSNQSICFICEILLKHCNICNYMLCQSHPMGWGYFGPKLIIMFYFVCEFDVEGTVTDA